MFENFKYTHLLNHALYSILFPLPSQIWPKQSLPILLLRNWRKENRYQLLAWFVLKFYYSNERSLVAAARRQMRFESIDFHRQLDCQVQCAIWWILSLPRTWPQIEFGAKRGWRGARPFRIVRGQYFIWFTYTFNYSIKSNSLLQAGNMP